MSVETMGLRLGARRPVVSGVLAFRLRGDCSCSFARAPRPHRDRPGLGDGQRIKALIPQGSGAPSVQHLR